MRSTSVLSMLALAAATATPALAQGARPVPAAEPRPQFVTVTFDRAHLVPLHLKEYPAEQLTGVTLDAVPGSPIDYQSDDGTTTVDITEFQRQMEGFGVAVYPFGARNGATLMVRGSIESVPHLRITMVRPSGVEHYQLTDGRAYDVGAGVYVSDRPAGWGLGSNAFVLGGVGRLTGERGPGRRYFAEGGGGMSVGPIGVQLAVKFGWNRFEDPREHAFITVPITLRAALSF
jgi:hypothetical protein